MRSLLASPLGLVVGLALGALGSGGSILAVPVLVYAAGQSVPAATATSLLLVGVAAVAGLPAHWRAGRVRLGTGLGFGVTGVGGSLAGTVLNRRLDPDVLLLGFSGLIVIAAHRMLTACPTCTRVGEARAVGGASTSTPRRIDMQRALQVLAAGTGVGFLTGLFGVGGGFVIVPALTLVLGLAMPEAIGTSLVAIAVNSAVALAGRIATTPIDWAIAAPFMVTAVTGVWLGGAIADRLDPARALRAFAALLIGVASFIALRAIAALA